MQVRVDSVVFGSLPIALDRLLLPRFFLDSSPAFVFPKRRISLHTVITVFILPSLTVETSSEFLPRHS